MTRRLLFLLVVFCARTLSVPAAEYRFDSWTTDNGLPQNGVRAIVQTPDGYIWFTTFDGLVRFDGVKFTVFDKGNTKGIINNRFGVLYAAPDGTLWAGTEDGSMTVRRNGVFTSVAREQMPEGVHSFVPDINGETRILTGRGFYYFRDDQFVYSAPESDDLKKGIFRGRSGAVWMLTAREVRQSKDGRETIYPVRLTEVGKLDLRVSVYEDRHGGLWIGQPGTLYHLQDGKTTSYAERDGIPKNTAPHRFWEETDGSLWFATGDYNLPGVGLVRFKDGRFARFGPEVGLSDDRIFGIFKDREGTIWVATNKGLNRLRRQIITPLSTKDGLVHNEVYPIMQALGGEILIGTSGGLSRYESGKMVNNPSSLSGISVTNIQALMEDADGRLWVGVVGGLDRYEQGKKTSFETGSTVAAVTADRNGNFWVGGIKGLTRINDDKITAHYTTKEGLSGDDVKAIHEDKQGTLWIGTYGGLSRMSVPNASGGWATATVPEFTNYRTQDGLASDRVRSIYQDADGVFWIGTYDGGLSRLKDGKFFNFTVENGLFNNGVFATVEDNYGNFWISCNKGIYRVSKQHLDDFADGKIDRYESFSYGREDGMLNTECNGGRQPSALKDKDGKIWFPTLEGVAIVDPSLVSANPLPPLVAIESVLVDRQDTFFAERINVGTSQTSLDIIYTGLSFINSNQVRFKYKLDGLDDDWVDAGTRRSVNYSYLPPGEYTFTVTAANSDGVWNPEGRSIKVAVLAPFYRTWWFPALVALFVVGVVLLIYRNRVAQLDRMQAAREAFSRQLIESQEGERKRIAAELHDSLGQNLLVIKNRALLGLSATDEGKARQQFDEIKDSVAEALADVRSIAYDLRPLHLERLGLTSTLEEMVEQVQEASGIGISADIADIDGVFDKQGEINFYRIVQECLNNVVKHSGAKKASVNVERDGSELVLTVRDDGVGFDVTRADGAGLGLNGIAERTKILGGVHSIESSPGQGTTVKVEISERP